MSKAACLCGTLIRQAAVWWAARTHSTQQLLSKRSCLILVGHPSCSSQASAARAAHKHAVAKPCCKASAECCNAHMQSNKEQRVKIG